MDPRILGASRRLSEKDLAIFNAEVDRSRRSPVIGYLLLIFLAGLGAHSFYAGRPIRGVAFIVLNLVSIFCIFMAFLGGIATAAATEDSTATAGVLGLFTILSWVAGIPYFFMWLWDLFTLPKQLEDRVTRIATQLLQQLGVDVSGP